MTTPTSSTTAKKPKGILKKPKPDPVEEAKKREAEVRARETAVKRAQIIQDQRDLQDKILDSIIVLSKLPLERSPEYSASNPSLSDASTFRHHVRLFQPSDYDDLIEERNTLGHCGYTLCPKPHIVVKQAGEWKLVNYGHKDFNIVPKKEIEKWCSQKCARRAMYVKVQLEETDAWERAGIDSIQIDLYDEPKEAVDDPTSRLAKEMEELKVAAGKKTVDDARNLAVERGDVGVTSSERTVKVAIKEKETTEAADGPSFSKDDDGYLAVDGYKTKFETQTRRNDGDY